MQKISEIVDALLSNIPYHAKESEFYKKTERELLDLISSSELRKGGNSTFDFSPFGEINFPYIEMGAINTLHLFGLDEIIIFAYYFANRGKYKKVADLGANLGLHTLILNRCGFEVECYEPDPIHFEILNNNLMANGCENVRPIQKAISDCKGTVNFVRVLGNTTGSHLEGAKENAYGDLEKFSVSTEDISKILERHDFVKMDIEGQEAKALLSTSENEWKNVDMMLEVGTEENATLIFHHLRSINVNMFSQKKGWAIVENVSDIPSSYKEGSLFVSKKSKMDWQ